MGNGESTPRKHRGLKEPWQRGQSGNPAGRPKGSRNKLAEAFIADLYADWTEHGVGAIEKVRQERPQDYLKIVASILPRDLNVRVNDLEDLTEEELNARIRALSNDPTIRQILDGDEPVGMVN